jgi:hypothetical protein
MAKRKRRSLGLVEVSSPVFKIIQVIMVRHGFTNELEAVKMAIRNEARREKITISLIG